MPTTKPSNERSLLADKAAELFLDHGRTIEQAAAEVGLAVQMVKVAVAHEEGRREIAYEEEIARIESRDYRIPKKLLDLRARVSALEAKLKTLQLKLRAMEEATFDFDPEPYPGWQKGSHIDSLPKQPPIDQLDPKASIAPRKRKRKRKVRGDRHEKL
jgi:hypothetical protein